MTLYIRAASLQYGLQYADEDDKPMPLLQQINYRPDDEQTKRVILLWPNKPDQYGVSMCT